MIHTTKIIQYLREKLPSWSIDGAVELAIAEDASRLPLPAMYIGLLPFVITKTNHETYLQEYDENFAIITCTPTVPGDDRTGKYAQDFVPITRQILFKLLVNNPQFDPDSHAIEFVRDMPEKLDRVRYYHKFEFRIAGLISPEDATPLTLDYFDKLFVDYVVDGSTDGTPKEKQIITPLYFIPENY